MAITVVLCFPVKLLFTLDLHFFHQYLFQSQSGFAIIDLLVKKNPCEKQLFLLYLQHILE